MTILTPLALQNASTLRAFRPAPTATDLNVIFTLKDLAEKVRRDRSNLSKALTTLEEAGYLAIDGRDPIVARLTADGFAMVDALDRADGVPTASVAALPDGFIAVRHDQIGQDPDNARKTSGLSPEAIQDMADSLLDKGMLQQPELRKNPDYPAWGPEYLLTMGERRWRGWGLNIELGRWPADKLIVCKLENRGEVERLEAGLVENLQRADISNLEMAEGFLILHDRHGRTPQEIAKKVGKTSRFVQIAIKVAREATADDKAKYVESERAYAEGKAANLPGIRRLFTWEDLRNTVKTAKYVTALEKRGRLTLMVAELALKVETDPSALTIEHDHHDSELMVTEINVPPGGGYWGEGQDLGVVVDHREADGKVYGGVTDAAREWLKDAGFDKDARGWIKALAIEALGPMPVRLAEEAGIWNTQFLNPPKPPPEPVAPPAPAVAQTPARDSFADQIRQVNAEEIEAGQAFVKPTDLGGSATPATVAAVPPTSPGPDLTPEQFLILVEVAHKISTRPVQARGGAITGCEVYDFHTGPHAKPAQELIMARMLSFVQSPNGNAFLATLTQAAWNYLGVSHIDDETLEGHRHDNLDFDELTAFEATGEKYLTTWLRAPVKVSAPKPASEETASEEECPKCVQSRENARAAGHRDWKDGVCGDHAGVVLDDEAPFEADAERTDTDDAASFMGEDEAEETPTSSQRALDVAGMIRRCSNYLMIAEDKAGVTTIHFPVCTKTDANDLAVALIASGGFAKVTLHSETFGLLQTWAA